MLIQSATKKYEVSIHSSLDPVKDMAVDEKTFVVIDKQVYELYCGQLFRNIPQDRLYLLEATEVNKVLDTALDICERMTSIPAKRNAKLISVGGGIVTGAETVLSGVRASSLSAWRSCSSLRFCRSLRSSTARESSPR